MSESPQLHTILCEEVFDENSVPSEEEVIDYAAKIGIDPKNEPHLLPIALNGLMHPLPPEWKPCFDSDLQKWYYFNTETKKSQWEHPLDSFYRQVVKRGRSEGYSSAGDDDSKTTAKEDLKSYEEASDILSSKSVDIKPDVGEEKKELTVMNERGPLLKGSQPLLLRRKQLQSGQDPLHVAKLINSTLRHSLPKEDDPYRSPFSDLPMPTPALRRSHTSDVISPHPPPIKGILRESSFSGSMSSSARPSSVRLGPLQGDLDNPKTDIEDEKKRSVRFADFERKSLDIRFQLSDSDETYSDVEDDSASSGSIDIEKDHKEDKIEGKPTILSPLQHNSFGHNFSGDVPRTRKFTVTPVKESTFSFPASELKGLFRTESVVPLDSDSDGSLGIKVGGSLMTEDDKDSKAGDASVRSAQAVPDLTSLKEVQLESSSESSPVKLSKSNDKELQIKRTTAVTDISQHPTEHSCNHRKNAAESATDLTDYASAVSLVPPESSENLFQAQKDELLIWQKKLNEEYEKQVEELKKLKTENLAQVKETLMKSEEIDKVKLKEESQERIKILKDTLQEEFLEKERELRHTLRAQLEKLSDSLKEEREKEMASVKSEHSELLKKWKQAQEEALNEEKIRLDNESYDNLQKIKAELKYKLDELKKQSESEVQEFLQSSQKHIEAMKLKNEELVKEISLKHQNEIKEMEENHKLRFEFLKSGKELELKRCEGEWDDRLTATSLSQKAQLESMEKEHEGRLARLKADWEREEAEMRKRRIPLDQQPLQVDYEKLRCEKRLLEDKYRILKEKYVQLKSDMKLAVEKKLQARARRKREELERGDGTVERPKNLNTELQPSLLATPRITVGEVSPRDITDPSSDDQYTLSYTLPDKHVSSKRGKNYRRDLTVTSRLNEERCHAEEISGDIYLRHPLSLGLSRSAEVDVSHQRLHSDDENIRSAKENLEDKRRHLESSRDVLENNNSFGLHQEQDLNDLEVSLHRTRALFGEKMLRLRLLGQTLSRLADDTTSPPSSAGGEVLTPSNVLQNLDNINAEIKEIWNQLNKNQSAMSAGTCSGNEYHKTEEKAPPKSSSHIHHHRPSKRSEIEARLQGLRDWLQKPPPPDWAQLTL